MNLLLLISAALVTSVLSEETEWRPLLDPELSQWEVFIGVPHKSVKIPGEPSSESKNGTTGTPLGLGKDPLNVFVARQEGDDTILRISGQIYGFSARRRNLKTTT